MPREFDEMSSGTPREMAVEFTPKRIHAETALEGLEVSITLFGCRVMKRSNLSLRPRSEGGSSTQRMPNGPPQEEPRDR